MLIRQRLKKSRQKPGVTWSLQKLGEAGRTFPCSLPWEGSPADPCSRVSGSRTERDPFLLHTGPGLVVRCSSPRTLR